MLKYVPLSKIDRMQIYINKSRKTMAKIKKETGADDIINAGFFNGNWTPCGHVKADGTVYVDEGYIYNCMAWNNPPLDLCMTPIPTNKTKYSNYISCVALIVNGKKDMYAINNADKAVGVGALANGKKYATKRSAVGMKNGQLALYCDTKAMIPSQLADYLFNQGWTELLMLDGGGSVQCNFEGQTITSTRIVHNLILVYYKKNTPVTPPTPPKEERPPSTDVNTITQAFITGSDCYKAGQTIIPKGIMVHSTATPPVMAREFRDLWNKPNVNMAVHAFIDDRETIQTLPWNWRGWHAGGSANNTHIGFEVCEPQECRLIPAEWRPLKRGDSGWAVTRLQMELKARGFDPNGTDGSFGIGCESALKRFQSSINLTADGSCGPATHTALRSRSGSYLAYDPKDTDAYVKAAYERAVALCVILCKQYGFNPTKDILCHAEGYRSGIATNSADVNHWWPLHGKTMDGFRADVAKAMTGDVKPIEPEKPNPVENNVTRAQTLLNSKFNSGIAVDGSWGPESKKAYIMAIQSTLNSVYNKNLTVDGSFGPASRNACPDLRYYVKNDLVYCLQIGLLAKGFNVDVDGSYGRGTESTVRQYQTLYELNPDGIAGANTFTGLVS